MLGRNDQVQRAGSIAAIVGVATASQYLFLTSVLEARFLLPSYALLTVSMLAALPSWPEAHRRIQAEIGRRISEETSHARSAIHPVRSRHRPR